MFKVCVAPFETTPEVHGNHNVCKLPDPDFLHSGSKGFNGGNLVPIVLSYERLLVFSR